MVLLDISNLSLPLTNPVLKFFIILLIILFAPMLLNRFKIPPVLGLIISGAIVGPNGLNLILRDSGIILSGTAGLLYIMFLAGLEINLSEFKKNSGRSLIFGLLTFSIPMTLGIFSSMYLLNFSLVTSILLASMYASHTLIAYPMISKLGASGNRAVAVTVGGTVITDTLALLILAVVAGSSKGDIGLFFWIKLSVLVILFAVLVLAGFPVIARWFLKRTEDHVTQFIFVLAMVFLGAVLAEAAGIEGIIGAFLAGLALNRLIPRTSALMNRIDFTGNAIFIPFLLISVGMLIDYRAFFSGTGTILVASVMTIVAIVAKFSAAWITQKILGYTADERRLIFGLSNAQAAATLAAVLVGYNIITGQTASGEPIRLLNDDVLNGTIIMILITCTIASFSAQKGALRLARVSSPGKKNKSVPPEEKILIPISNPENIDELIQMGTLIRNRSQNHPLLVLNVIFTENEDEEAVTHAQKMLEKAEIAASGADVYVKKFLRYDLEAAQGIIHTVKENSISDLLVGLHIKSSLSDSFLGKLTQTILTKTNVTTLVYKPVQPISTIIRHIVMIPEYAENEIGFTFWFLKLKNMGINSGTKFLFHGTDATLQIIRNLTSGIPMDCEFKLNQEWAGFIKNSRNIKINDHIIFIMSRKHKVSHTAEMETLPDLVRDYLGKNSITLIYPVQAGVTESNRIDLVNPSLIKPF